MLLFLVSVTKESIENGFGFPFSQKRPCSLLVLIANVTLAHLLRLKIHIFSWQSLSSDRRLYLHNRPPPPPKKKEKKMKLKIRCGWTNQYKTIAFILHNIHNLYMHLRRQCDSISTSVHLETLTPNVLFFNLYFVLMLYGHSTNFSHVWAISCLPGLNQY